MYIYMFINLLCFKMILFDDLVISIFKYNLLFNVCRQFSMYFSLHNI